ncbi:TadE/TadG family type IV pilus assembly protein [Jiella sp. M17.18]|uniref:TadE/TadG family type IV pilus assembly protein n=1 Tax=Jiella sp. M17.18 TaxID=3234247 RepID=UPI0034DFABD5
MSGAASRLRRFGRDEAGATAVEFAIVCLPLLLVIFGILDFGRALNARNDLGYAAGVASRRVLVDPGLSDADLEQAVRDAFSSGDPAQLQIAVGTQTGGGTNFRTLSVTYPFTFLLVPALDGTITLDVARKIPVK